LWAKTVRMLRPTPDHDGMADGNRGLSLHRCQPWLSVVIPARNEAALIGGTLERVCGVEGVQVIVVDGQSDDTTVQVAESYGVTVLTCAPGRARQMNFGAAYAQGEVVLFLHADTLVPTRFDQLLRRTLGQPGIVGGAFVLQIDGAKPSLRVVEAAVNLRSRILQMPYGDQGIFLKADVFRRLGGYRDLPVLEDYELIRRLRRAGRVGLVPQAVRTSARRWAKKGVWRTTVAHQMMIAAYHLGVSPERLARWR